MTEERQKSEIEAARHVPRQNLPDQPSVSQPFDWHELCEHHVVSRVVVSDFRSLRGAIVFRPLLARQSPGFARLSPAVKIPFQTRIGQADRKSSRGELMA